MIFTRNLLARLLQKEFVELPLEIAIQVISEMSDEKLCEEFHLEILRKGFFTNKIN